MDQHRQTDSGLNETEERPFGLPPYEGPPGDVHFYNVNQGDPLARKRQYLHSLERGHVVHKHVHAAKKECVEGCTIIDQDGEMD